MRLKILRALLFPTAFLAFALLTLDAWNERLLSTCNTGIAPCFNNVPAVAALYIAIIITGYIGYIFLKRNNDATIAKNASIISSVIVIAAATVFSGYISVSAQFGYLKIVRIVLLTILYPLANIAIYESRMRRTTNIDYKKFSNARSLLFSFIPASILVIFSFIQHYLLSYGYVIGMGVAWMITRDYLKQRNIKNYVNVSLYISLIAGFSAYAIEGIVAKIFYLDQTNVLSSPVFNPRNIVLALLSFLFFVGTYYFFLKYFSKKD